MLPIQPRSFGMAKDLLQADGIACVMSGDGEA